MPATHPNTTLATLQTNAPVVDFWSNGNPNNLLVLHTHGMQDPPTPSLNADLFVLAQKSYAFIVPFNTAMNNAGFLNAPQTIEPYVQAFNRYRSQFMATSPPSLRIYPYLVPLAGLDAVLDAIHGLGICDTMKLRDLNPWPVSQHIHLIDMLTATHPIANGSLQNTYDHFLLLACRTSTNGHVIGMGGGVATYPDGLYSQEDEPALHQHPFRVRRGSI